MNVLLYYYTLHWSKGMSIEKKMDWIFMHCLGITLYFRKSSSSTVAVFYNTSSPPTLSGSVARKKKSDYFMH